MKYTTTNILIYKYAVQHPSDNLIVLFANTSSFVYIHVNHNQSVENGCRGTLEKIIFNFAALHALEIKKCLER